MMEGVSDVIEYAKNKFRGSGAISADTAKTLPQIGFDFEKNRFDQMALKYLLDMHYAIQADDRYFLDENACANPLKTAVKKALKPTIIIFAVSLAFVLLLYAIYFLRAK